jgi:hypothetical protein
VNRLALALAAIVAAGLATVAPATAAHADNGDMIPHVDAVLTADLHGNTAGTVTSCVHVTGNPVRIVSWRVHGLWDGQQTRRTRMGHGGVTIHRGVCATTGAVYRGRFAWVNVSVVDQVTGAYGTLSMPVDD